MSSTKIIAIVLIVAGVLGLAYGRFTYTETHDTKVGPIEMSVKDKESVNIPRVGGCRRHRHRRRAAARGWTASLIYR